MRLRHLVVTLSAAAAGQPLTTDRAIVGYYVSIQQAPANTGALFVGGFNSLGQQMASSTDYGITIPAPVTGTPPPPYPIGNWHQAMQVCLNDIWVKGTTAEKVTVSYWAPDKA